MEESLNLIETSWFNLNGKLLDVISGFAGQELFIIDGDALLQFILDDELLALGKKDDISFQLVHSIWLLESFIQSLLVRDCNFEIIYFDTNLHSSIKTGTSEYITASRTLARSILKRSNLPNIKIHSFKSNLDLDWLSYYNRKRPMFLLGHDGGLVDKNLIEADTLQGERILCQKSFLFGLLKVLPVVLIQTIDFKDGKMISFVYEKIHQHVSLLPSILLTADEAHELMNSKIVPAFRSISTPISSSQNDIIESASKSFLASTSDDPLASSFLHLYLAHISLLSAIPLSSRAQILPKISEELTKYLTKEFLPKLYGCISQTVETLPALEALPFFDLDGRLFGLLMLEVLTSASPLSDILGPIIIDKLATSFPSLPILNLDLLRSKFPSESNQLPPLPPPKPSTLLPFSNETFNSHFTSVHVSISEALTPSSTINKLDRDTSFDDERVYVGPKPQLLSQHGTAPPVQLDARERKKRDRKEQRYMAQMQKSASSLTGALGTSLKQQVIPTVGKRSTAKVVKVSNVVRAQPKSGKVVVKVLNSKEKLIAENAAKKQAEEGILNAAWWDEKLLELKPLSVPSQISLIGGFLKNKRASDKWLGTEIILKRLDLELRKWIADEKREDREVGDVYRVFLARTTSDLLVKAKKGEILINEKQGKALVGLLEVLGLTVLIPESMTFGAAAEAGRVEANGGSGKSSKKGGAAKSGKKEKVIEKEESSGVKLTFSWVKLTKDGKPTYEYMKVNEDPIEFQLRCMGEYMVRSLDSRPDDRVTFEPDAWQIEVLDKIDRDESMLIVAPTSSGKTFISFAAMEKVLRDSDDGIIIYVAPSKALVNQVAAEVFARFSKDVPGAHLWAIETNDYRINNPSNCQILVTVPHVLSRMLLSPALASVWTPRIKRIIVDEIHSISEEEGGAIWEQVLLMNPAPIIGLSATVGAPERFSDWLASVEKNRGREYSLIQHHHRFNALRKFAYAPQFPVKQIGPLNEHKVNASQVFPYVHPIAALGLGESELPSDLALEPRDCLSLWKAMSKSGASIDPSLTPSNYFVKTSNIAIKDVIRYEKDLKKVLVEMMEAKNSKDVDSPFQKVIKSLVEPLEKALVEPQQAIAEGGGHAFFSVYTPLLADLNSQGNLPAILFNFDRIACENICKVVLKDLEAAEENWRLKSPEYKKKVAKAKEDEKLARAKAKANESAARNKKDEDDARGGDEESANTFDPEAPSEEFSFVGKGISQVEFAKEISELAWLNLPSYLINALRRGIAVHHSGLNRRYRTLVENLFRRGVLKVVISTGTLALGINAPARSCVFAGDSIHLTALNFRQCSGRAGRRGFDNIGMVQFVGIPLDRIQRLLLSRLPKLGGTFPLSTTLVLRLHNLLSGSNAAEVPVKTVDKLLSLPQLSVGNKTDQDQVRHFVRFSIEYLRRVGLLDEFGRPLSMYNIVSTLYPFEPSNFLLVALLRSGTLHQIAKSFEIDETATLEKLCTVFAYLFGRVLRRKQSPESLVTDTRNSTSLMVLPPLPSKVKIALDEHQLSVVSIFSTYAQQYCQQHSEDLGPDMTLPISKTTLSAPSDSLDGSFASKLRQSALVVDSRSPFVATSGLGDNYKSIAELSNTSRSGLILTKHAVPVSPDIAKEHDLDSYVLDFFRHGSLEMLIRDNSLVRGNVWFKLQEFDQALATIKLSFETLLQRSSDEREEDNDSDAGDADGLDDKSTETMIPRPASVNNADWQLYVAIATLSTEFRTKFFKIYA